MGVCISRKEGCALIPAIHVPCRFAPFFTPFPCPAGRCFGLYLSFFVMALFWNVVQFTCITEQVRFVSRSLNFEAVRGWPRAWNGDCSKCTPPKSVIAVREPKITAGLSLRLVTRLSAIYLWKEYVMLLRPLVVYKRRVALPETLPFRPGPAPFQILNPGAWVGVIAR